MVKAACPEKCNETAQMTHIQRADSRKDPAPLPPPYRSKAKKGKRQNKKKTDKRSQKGRRTTTNIGPAKATAAELSAFMDDVQTTKSESFVVVSGDRTAAACFGFDNGNIAPATPAYPDVGAGDNSWLALPWDQWACAAAS